MMLFVNDVERAIPFSDQHTNPRRSGSPHNTMTLESSITFYQRKPDVMTSLRWHLRSNFYFTADRGRTYRKDHSRRSWMPVSFCSRAGRKFDLFEVVGFTT